MWRLKTTDYRSDGIFSELWRDETKFCATAEHAYIGPYGFVPKLLRGATYTCRRGEHQLEHGGPFITFEIMDVPGRSGILFHIGNFPQRDSNGCVLTGGSVIKDATWWVNNSKDVFAGFMQAMVGVDAFELEVS